MAEEQYRISDLTPATRVHGGQLLEIADLSEPSVSLRSRSLTIDKLSDYIKSGIPTAPEGVVWIEQPAIEIEESAFIRAIYAASADWDGLIVNYPEGTIQNVTLPGAGLERFDAVYALENGTYGVSTGDASQSPVTPQIPTDALFVTYVKWTSTGGEISKPGIIPASATMYAEVDSLFAYGKPDAILRINYNGAGGYGWPVENANGIATLINDYPAGSIRFANYDGTVWEMQRYLDGNNNIAYSEWLQVGGGSDSLYGPYVSIADALVAVPDTLDDNGVSLRKTTPSVGVIEDGVVKEYWWPRGTGDSDYELKSREEAVEINPTRAGLGEFISITGSGLGLVTSAFFGEFDQQVFVVEASQNSVVLQITDPLMPVTSRILLHTSDGKEIYTTNDFTYIDIQLTGADLETVSPGQRLWFTGQNAYTIAFIVFSGNILAPFRQYLANPGSVGYIDVPVDVQNGVSPLAFITSSGTYGETNIVVTVENANTGGTGGGGSVTVVQTTGQSTTDVMSQKAVTDELGKLKPSGLTTFTATNTFNANKVMKLGGTGDTFNANHVLTQGASGNVMDTFLTLIVTGNGTNTISFGTGWQNENGGTFNTTSGRKNVIRMHYIDGNNKFYTITQPL